MAKYVISGGKKLCGNLTLSGNKNSILPCLAATVLSDQEVVLRNVPKIADVEIFVNILKDLGAKVEYLDHTVKVCNRNLNKHSLPHDLNVKLRASLLLVGPLLARLGKVEFIHPGGDVIGKRSISTHLDGFKSLGFDFEVSDRIYNAKRREKLSGKTEIFLEEASVTGTENLILGAVLGEDEVVLKNCVEEPHVVDLCNMLNLMGASIEGIGTSSLKIKGARELSGVDFTVGSDPIEAGTYAVAAAITGGEIKIKKDNLPDMLPITTPLKKMGINFQENKAEIKVSAQKIEPITKLVINIWPGFPTDMMSAAIVLATQADGVSLLHDWMYESRMFFVDKLIAMGANIIIADPHRVLVYGPQKLYARNLETPDIRAGMALVLAALLAEGTSTIDKAELIERGYEEVVAKLSALGADIKRLA